jgi:SAM-dependent methyltransferase
MPFARRTGATVVGIDVAPTLLARALSEVPRNVRLVAADVEALPFATGAFDAVIGNAVLHHLRLERALPELLRVLRPGGRFCFAEPNMLNPQVFVERNVRFIGRWLDNSPDETAFTRWGLRRTLARHGLVDVAIRPFDFLYPLTPERLVPMVERVGRLLERTPLVAEIAGSLLVSARKP